MWPGSYVAWVLCGPGSMWPGFYVARVLCGLGSMWPGFYVARFYVAWVLCGPDVEFILQLVFLSVTFMQGFSGPIKTKSDWLILVS